MDINKEKTIQYSTAVVVVLSGIVMAFLAGIYNNYHIHESVLGYVGECFIFAGGIFGVGFYISKRLGEFRIEMDKKLDDLKSDKKANN